MTSENWFYFYLNPRRQLTRYSISTSAETFHKKNKCQRVKHRNVELGGGGGEMLGRHETGVLRQLMR